MAVEDSKRPRTPRQEAYRRRQTLQGHRRFLRIRWFGQAHPDLSLDRIGAIFAVTGSRISFILNNDERHRRILNELEITDAEARERYGEIPPDGYPWDTGEEEDAGAEADGSPNLDLTKGDTISGASKESCPVELPYQLRVRPGHRAPSADDSRSRKSGAC